MFISLCGDIVLTFLHADIFRGIKKQTVRKRSVLYMCSSVARRLQAVAVYADNGVRSIRACSGSPHCPCGSGLDSGRGVILCSRSSEQSLPMRDGKTDPGEFPTHVLSASTPTLVPFWAVTPWTYELFYKVYGRVPFPWTTGCCPPCSLCVSPGTTPSILRLSA